MAAEDVDTSRVAVKTYVPAYQKEAWAAEAEELDMSQSEFVRTMVQAGRRGFLDELDTDLDPVPEADTDGSTASEDSEPDATADVDASDATTQNEPGADGQAIDIADRAFHLIAAEEPIDWDDLHTELVGDLEAELDRSLQELQAENRITYSGREGGYVVLEGENAR